MKRLTLLCSVLALWVFACSNSSSGSSAGAAETAPAASPAASSTAEPAAAPTNPSGAGAYAALCEKTCVAKKGCGMLNPTTLEECEFGCVHTLNSTLPCKPSPADIERCVAESAAADCVTIATIGGAVPCKLCP